MQPVGAELSDARSGFIAAHRSWLLWATLHVPRASPA